MEQKDQPTVLITGAASGLGKALTLKLAQCGWLVFAGVRKEQDVRQLKEQKLSNLQPLLLDVTVPEQIAAAFQQIQEFTQKQGLTALINNAGVNYIAPFELAEAQKERALMETNLWGAMQTSRAMLPLLRQYTQFHAQKAMIINVSSIGGVLGLPWESAYHASKFAVLGWSQSLRAELAALGINVVCFLPGGMKTAIFKKAAGSNFPSSASLDPQLQNYYARNHQGMIQTMADFENSAAPVEQAALKIVRILERRNAPLRVYFGVDAFFLRLITALGLGNVLLKRFVKPLESI